ncbi:MAG TPA: methanogenesis marker protein Mmp4/MtxX [Methanotrichaceae archaeon]|nr:methanogenesis marker protein Mmp4/MtxX [Methanotrichaceae archaeon]
MDQGFISAMQDRARARRARIGIGIQNADGALMESLKDSSEYADLLLVGGPCCSGSCGCWGSLDFIESDDPATELVSLLANGEIDGAVRGNVSATRAMKALNRQFGIKIRRMALLELAGWSFFLAPVGIDEGESVSDRLELALSASEYLRKMGVSPVMSVLSGGRMEDVGRSPAVDRSLADGEFIAARARDYGIAASHRGILIESCRGDDLLLAPDGISGNLIFRTLHLLCGANALGALVLMDRVFIDSSRARGGFAGPIMAASALVAMRESEDSICNKK